MARLIPRTRRRQGRESRNAQGYERTAVPPFAPARHGSTLPRVPFPRPPFTWLLALLLAWLLALLSLACMILSVTSLWRSARYGIEHEHYFVTAPERAMHERGLRRRNLATWVSKGGFAFRMEQHWGALGDTSGWMAAAPPTFDIWQQHGSIVPAQKYPTVVPFTGGNARSGSFAGIAYSGFHFNAWGGANAVIHIVFPLPLLAVWFAVYPVWRLWRWRRSRRKVDRGFAVGPPATDRALAARQRIGAAGELPAVR